ncbi:MAG TPA: glycosyltransferase [Bacteroidales bacterium]|nr:glycosyltransferase [Bacteroidales bacterium]
MLSILIPEYNCDCTRLVRDLADQCLQERIDYEILVLDDASPDFKKENLDLHFITGCIFFKNEVNMSQASCRNSLAKRARFPWLLFLDSDLQVVDIHFIRRYLEVLGQANVLVGGIINSPEKPAADRMLRWKYSRNRECLSAEVRNKHPWHSFFSSNILMEKSVHELIPFDEQFKNYGHEDTLLGYRMKSQGFTILNIDNPLLHLGIEQSEQFLAKSLTAAIKFLDLPVFQTDELVQEIKLFRVYRFIKRLGMEAVIAWKFKILEKLLHRNLTGPHPSLFSFDFYRLGYLCREARSRRKTQL